MTGTELMRALYAHDLAREAGRAERIAEMMTSVQIAQGIIDEYVDMALLAEPLDARIASRVRRILESLGRLYQDLGRALAEDA